MGAIIDGNRVVFLYGGFPPDSMVKDYWSIYTEFRMLNRRSRVLLDADEIQLRGLQSHPAGEEEGDDA